MPQNESPKTDQGTPVTRALDQLGIPYRTFRHPGPIRSLEQAARERGQRPNQVVRSIVFRLARDEYAMVLMAGPDQVSWRGLRSYLGQSRLTMANPQEVKQSTGYERGAVAPFGLPAPMRILVDESVFAQAEVSLGSGVRGTTVILRSSELKRALPGAEIGHFKEDQV
jgi:Cys-tRNA(Pro)/Cys-tRNA(Cys) deacylase